MNKQQYTLAEIADMLDATVHGDKQCVINGVASLMDAKEGQLSYLVGGKYKEHIQNTRASAVLLKDEDAKACKVNALITNNPELSFSKVASLFLTEPPPKVEIHQTAIIGDNCKIANDVSIGANCVIGDRVTIGPNCIIGPNTVIGADVAIGENCKLYGNVTLYHDLAIGDRVIIHSGAVIGADGFGLAHDGAHWHKIPQIGRVVIGNDVEVGANTAIDRGALSDTLIGEGVKLDNHIQIGHNVCIGAHTVIAGHAAIAGSACIGKHCMIGGACIISGHIELVDGVVLTGGTSVAFSIDKPGMYTCGWPALAKREWIRVVSRVLNIEKLANRLKKLEQKTHE